MTDDETSVSIAIASSQEDINTLSSLCGDTVKLGLEATVVESTPEEFSITGDDYMQHCLQGSSYAGLLKYGQYEEISDSVLKVLNQDWQEKSYYRIACGQLLAGAILVEGKEILLVSCVELYN